MNFEEGKTNEDWRCDVCVGCGEEAVDGSRSLVECSQCGGTGIWDDSMQENGNEKDEPDAD